MHLIQQGSSKTRIEYCLDNKESLCYLRAIQGHSGGIPIRPEMMEYTIIPHNWKEYIFHKGISWNSQSILVSGKIPGRKENDKDRQGVFFTTLDPFGNNPDEEKPHDDCTVPQKSKLPNLLETQSRCNVSDFSERRSIIIREARNTKASTQGYVKEQLACVAPCCQSVVQTKSWTSIMLLAIEQCSIDFSPGSTCMESDKLSVACSLNFLQHHLPACSRPETSCKADNVNSMHVDAHTNF